MDLEIRAQELANETKLAMSVVRVYDDSKSIYIIQTLGESPDLSEQKIGPFSSLFHTGMSYFKVQKTFHKEG